jgi:integrase/recombinase XerD
MDAIKWSCCPLAARNPLTHEYIEQLARERLAESTVENYSRDLEDFLRATQETPFEALLEADERFIARYVDWLYARERHVRTSPHPGGPSTTVPSRAYLAVSTIRRRISTLRGFYAWLIRIGYRKDAINPVRAGKRGVRRGLVPVLPAAPWIPTDQQFVDLLRHVFAHLSLRNQVLTLLIYDGALRREEATLLRVDDVDWRSRTIAIRRGLTKNHLPGIVVLSNVTTLLLRRYVDTVRARLVTTYHVDSQGPLFLSESLRNPGQPITKWTVKDVFDSLRAELGIPQLTPHKLRHLMLTHLHRSGMELLEISRYARHRSISSTEVYVHVDLTDLARRIGHAHQQRWKHLEELFAPTDPATSPGEEDGHTT